MLERITIYQFTNRFIIAKSPTREAFCFYEDDYENNIENGNKSQQFQDESLKTKS